MDDCFTLMQDFKETTSIHNSKIEQAVYDCLAYFDVFNHPLKINEVLDFLPKQSDLKSVDQALLALTSKGIIFQKENYYSLKNSTSNISIREADEQRAKSSIDDAKRYGKLISKFPFILGVSISGSLSKGLLKEDGDYDFFLIVKRKRIWIAKLLLKLYKVVFLGNSYEYFCINYLISDENLEIDEKNVFTATELLTVIPVAGNLDLFKSLYEANVWVARFLPNKQWTPYTQEIVNKTRISKIIQLLLDNKIGSLINKGIMAVTIYRNKVKYSKLKDSSIYTVAFKSTEDVSKVHPNNTQQVVLNSHSAKKEKFKCQS